MRALGIAGIALIAALVGVGCGGGDGESLPPSTDGDAGSEGGTDGGAADADGGDAVADADPDADAEPPKTGKTGGAIVAGGTTMKSASYTLITSVGQGPGGNAAMSSSSYQLRAGVVGATQP